MLRSLSAVAIGFVFMSVTVRVGAILAGALFMPDGALYLAMNLAVSACGAVLAGWLTARVAPRAPYGHAGALAAVVLIVTVVPALTAPQAAPQPAWYAGVVGAIAVSGVLLGGRLRSMAGSSVVR